MPSFPFSHDDRSVPVGMFIDLTVSQLSLHTKPRYTDIYHGFKKGGLNAVASKWRSRVDGSFHHQVLSGLMEESIWYHIHGTWWF